MRDVIIYSPSIRPGGGPSGYVFNLMVANQKFTTRNNISFVGKISYERKLQASQSFIEKIYAYFGARGIQLPMSLENKDLIKRSINSIVVIHGPINSKLLYKLRRSAYKLVFMPHSPSLCCDEYIMTYSSVKRQLNSRIYFNLRWMERVCFAYSDYIVFPSLNASKVYSRAYLDIITSRNVEYIPSGVSMDAVEDSINQSYEVCESKKSIRVGFVGRFNSHKGYDIFSQVANLLGACDVEFVSFGSGPLAEISSKVENQGWVEDISAALLTCDILVVPNRVAYYDLLPLEAACHGRPIVFTPVGGNVDQARDLPDSILAKSTETKDVADAVLQALSKKRQDCRWGARNREIFNSTFTEESLMQRWDDFLISIQ